MKNYAIIFLLLSLSACSFFKKKKSGTGDVIAHVNDEYLYAGDIPQMTKGLKGDDSTAALKSYAENWVRRKLLLQKASENIPEDDVGITKKMEDYHESLLLYEYEKALINKRLDTVVREQELNDWYEKMKGGIVLENDVYHAYFIKLKKDAPDLDNARKWILKPKDEEDARKLEGYCREYATSYMIDDGMWYEKDNVLKNFPIADADISALTITKGYREYKTESGILFLKITEVLKKDQTPPLDFIKPQVEKAIIEKRRLQLLEKIYDKIYQDGLRAKQFEILVK